MTPKPPPEFMARVASILLMVRNGSYGKAKEEEEVAVHMKLSVAAARHLIALSDGTEVIKVDPQYIPERGSN